MRRSSDIDLGLAILRATSAPGQSKTYKEIAAFCGCTWQAIWHIEQAAMKKLRNRAAFQNDPLLRELVNFNPH